MKVESFNTNTIDMLHAMGNTFGFKVNTKLNFANMTILFGKKKRWGNYRKFAIQTTPGNVLADVKQLLTRDLKIFAVE